MNRTWRYYCPNPDCQWHKESKTKIKGIVGYLCKSCKKECILDASDDKEPTFHVFVEKDPKTVGHLAHRNADKFGNAFLEDKEALYKQKRRDAAEKTAKTAGGKLMKRDANAKPWWRDGSIQGVKKYAKSTDMPEIKNPEKYIKTGEL
jgi:hypothetical protein